MYAFFDQPELMHQMNMDITDFNIKTFEKISKICTPTFVTFAEDMSYNNGPMLSRKMFNEFIAPYYKRIIPYLKEKDVVVLIDSDGYVLPMIDWLNDLGIDGILPLEHQAGVDVNNLQQEHPDFGLLGNFDKLVMDKGEKAIRDEFERLKPAISRGRFIPSVDHQTPPSVSLEQYKIYLEILREYTKRN
jgi:uroporphyrinogen-III decarboxylase